uniref:Vitellogenin C n=1 Tax=Pomatoschistus minutus TaxID=13225 RepID=S4VM47_POMMI|nr:vitellogenin C [Pomatoschistus minutus]
MQALILCCLVALAAGLRYDLSLNPNKNYEYEYEGWVKLGLGKPNQAEAGARIRTNVTITGAPSNAFRMKFSNVLFEEFNGFPGKSGFVASDALAQKIKAQLEKAIEFTYSAGHVEEIRASPEVSDTVVNMVRGILGFFQVTVKSNQDIYEIEEAGIHGKCHSSYIAKRNNQANEMDLTQVVDVTNCMERVVCHTGLASAIAEQAAIKLGKAIFTTVQYTYKIKATEEAGLIDDAQAVELQYYTPFNVKKGSFKMEARKQLRLLSVKNKAQDSSQDSSQDNKNRVVESRGDIMFNAVKNLVNIPITMQRMDDVATKVQQAERLLTQLAETTSAHQPTSATNENAIKLYQLLRGIPLDQLKAMWRKVEGNAQERKWFLHTVVEVNDERVLSFLETVLQEKKLGTLEAVTAIVQAFNHLEATIEVVKKAENLLNLHYDEEILRRTVVLSYGSAVYKLCVYNTPCPREPIMPLLTMAEESRKANNEMEKILVLKALGNAGHPQSLKTIEKFLPGMNPNANQEEQSERVQSAAVQAMRLIAARDPHAVQMRTLKMFVNRELKPEIRMLSFMIMFDAQPSMALVSTLTAHLMKEKDMQVVNFAYTYFRSLSRAMTPDKHDVAIAASVAVKILAPRFVHLNYLESRGSRLDWFSNDLLMGTAAEVFLLKKASQFIPTEMMVKMNFHYIGMIMQLLEFNIRPDGIRHLFASNMDGNRDLSVVDFQTMYDILKKWETMPDNKPVLSVHTRVLGQEFFYGDLSKDIIRAFRPSEGQSSFVWKMIQQLIQGFSWRASLPILAVESRYIQPSTVGLPIEISKYYHVVNTMSVTAKAGVAPQLTQNLGQLLSSEVSVTTNGFIGYTKNLWLFYGINTDLFQSAVEIRSTNPVALPWNFVAKVNYRERKMELEISHSDREFELFSFSSNAYAISRNIINPEAPKQIELIPRVQSVNQMDPSHHGTPNTWNRVEKMCTQNTMYGVSLCSEYELKRVYYQDQSPLYYLLGFTHFAIQVKPVPGTSSEDKIRLELNAAPNAVSASVRQLLDTLRRIAKDGNRSQEGSRTSRGMEGTPEPVLNAKVLSKSRSQKVEGYEVSFYRMPEREGQLIVSHVGESANWKMCVHTALATELKAHFAWGAECQPNSVWVSSAYLNGNKPELKAVVHWDKVPEVMVANGTRIARYIPGMAYLFGFSQTEEQNTVQEISASVIAASADSFNVKIKLPELTLRRESLPSPADYQQSDRTVNSNTQA